MEREQIEAIAAEVRDALPTLAEQLGPDTEAVSVQGLIQEISVVDPGITLDDLIKIFDLAWLDENEAPIPVFWEKKAIALLLMLSPAAEPGITKDEANFLVQMAAQGKIGGVL